MTERFNGYEVHRMPTAEQSRCPHRHPYSKIIQPDPEVQVILKYRGTDGVLHIEIPRQGDFTWVGGVFHTIIFVGGGGTIIRPENWADYPHEERETL
jgi:hypothetical protein